MIGLKGVGGLLLFTVIINSCTGNHQNMTTPSKDCIALNNEGVDYLMNHSIEGEKALDKAIDLLTHATKCDSNYVTAYINLANAYDQKHNFAKEIIALNRILILTKNDPTYIMLKGMRFEKSGAIDSTTKMYSLAKTEYEKRLIKLPDDINLIKGIIRLTGITDGKDAAMKKLNEQIKMHPKLLSALSGEFDFYKTFDRHMYIFGVPSVENHNK